MSSRSPSADLAATLDLLGEVEPRALAEAITEQLQAWPSAQRTDSDRTTGHTTVLDENGDPMPSVSDPTGEAAIADDRARHDLDALESELREIHRRARVVWNISQRYMPKRALDPEQLRKLQSTGDPVCWYFARIGVERVPKHTTDLAAYLGKSRALPEPRPVSEPVLNFIRNYGREPSKAELREYQKTGKWGRVRAA